MQEIDAAQTLRAMLSRISALRALVSAGEDGDRAGQATPDLRELRRGLSELERMAGGLLYALRETGGDLLLADLPGVPLAEALSQLVEATAEELALSSRVVFSGQERPLPDYLARLLYRIAQEALAHTSEHQGARRLRFSLDYRDAGVVMTIEDDGVPGGAEQFFSAEPDRMTELPPFLATNQQTESQGGGEIIRGLRAMIEGLGGSLVINSGVEQGVQVHVHAPYQAVEATQASPAGSQEQGPGETSEKIKVLVVDSQTVSRAGLRRLLESYPDLEIVGEAGDGLQAVSETAELLPRLVLIDAQLPGEQTLETLRQLRQLNAEISVLLLVNRENEELLYEALRAGANGYVLKDSAPDELARAVRAAARGEVLVQPQLAARLLTRFGGQERSAGHPQESLTAREREVLQLLARGLRNKEIAARLFVSERTVSFHLANIYAKLHVSGRTEALSKALEQGLLADLAKRTAI
jgi:DNA-binding NarL/FixJ family response regulator